MASHYFKAPVSHKKKKKKKKTLSAPFRKTQKAIKKVDQEKRRKSALRNYYLQEDNL